MKEDVGSLYYLMHNGEVTMDSRVVHLLLLATIILSSLETVVCGFSQPFICTISFFFQEEDGIRDSSVTVVQTCVFFFQAEDGIRDSSVTGVQTCALPI